MSWSEDCRLFLAEKVGPQTVRLVDGCHGTPEDVAKAAKLHGRIFGAKGPWIMVELHSLPVADPPIDEEAASICADLLARRDLECGHE